MGFKFRKSKSFGPFKINVSKSGFGWSVGTKGARFTKRADGKKQTTLSIPGTGISYVDVQGESKNSNLNSDKYSSSSNNNAPKVPFYNKLWFIGLMLFFVPPVGILLLWTSKKYRKKTRCLLSATFAIYILFIIVPRIDKSTQNNNYISQGQPTTIEDEQTTKEKSVESERQKIAKEQVAAQEAEKQRTNCLYC